jgi:hypothetical protein
MALAHGTVNYGCPATGQSPCRRSGRVARYSVSSSSMARASFMSTVHVPRCTSDGLGPAGPAPRPAFPAAAIADQGSMPPAAPTTRSLVTGDVGGAPEADASHCRHRVAQAAHHPHTHFDALTRLGAHADSLATIARYRSDSGYEIPAEVVRVTGTARRGERGLDHGRLLTPPVLDDEPGNDHGPRAMDSYSLVGAPSRR